MSASTWTVAGRSFVSRSADVIGLSLAIVLGAYCVSVSAATLQPTPAAVCAALPRATLSKALGVGQWKPVPTLASNHLAKQYVAICDWNRNGVAPSAGGTVELEWEHWDPLNTPNISISGVDCSPQPPGPYGSSTLVPADQKFAPPGGCILSVIFTGDKPSRVYFYAKGTPVQNHAYSYTWLGLVVGRKVPARVVGKLWHDAASRLAAIDNVAPPTVSHIKLSPATASVRVGQARTYTVTAYDAAGDSLGPDANATLSIRPNGSCTGDQCTATAAGTHTVTATDGRLIATASLTASPEPPKPPGWPTGFTAHYVGQFIYSSPGVTLGVGGDVTVTFSQVGNSCDTTTPPAAGGFCDYTANQFTGTVTGRDQTNSLCTTTNLVGSSVGDVALSDDGKGSSGGRLELYLAEPPSVGFCIMGDPLSTLGWSTDQNAGTWSPGDATSSWPVYLSDGSTAEPAGTVAITWQY